MNPISGAMASTNVWYIYQCFHLFFYTATAREDQSYILAVRTNKEEEEENSMNQYIACAQSAACLSLHTYIVVSTVMTHDHDTMARTAAMAAKLSVHRHLLTYI